MVNFWVSFEKNSVNGGHNLFQQIRGERNIYRHNYVKISVNILEVGVNTKSDLRLPRSIQLGLEHCQKKPKGL